MWETTVTYDLTPLSGKNEYKWTQKIFNCFTLNSASEEKKEKDLVKVLIKVVAWYFCVSYVPAEPSTHALGYHNLWISQGRKSHGQIHLRVNLTWSLLQLTPGVSIEKHSECQYFFPFHWKLIFFLTSYILITVCPTFISPSSSSAIWTYCTSVSQQKTNSE